MQTIRIMGVLVLVEVLMQTVRVLPTAPLNGSIGIGGSIGADCTGASYSAVKWEFWFRLYGCFL